MDMQTTTHSNEETETMSETTLEAYVWHCYYDDAQEKRVSDWGMAEECGECGRQIVHVYTVRKSDNTVIAVGKECAHIALGWTHKNARRLDQMKMKAMCRMKEAERFRAYTLSEASAKALPTVEASLDAVSARNTNADHTPYSGPTVTFSINAKYYSLPAVCEMAMVVLMANGWQRVTA